MATIRGFRIVSSRFLALGALVAINATALAPAPAEAFSFNDPSFWGPSNYSPRPPHCNDQGGSVDLCLQQINEAIRSRMPYRIVRDCESACVLRLKYVACIDPNVTFRVHEVRNVPPGQTYSDGTFSPLGNLRYMGNLPQCMRRIVQQEGLMTSWYPSPVSATRVKMACNIPDC
jgi:hypothetical protein